MRDDELHTEHALLEKEPLAVLIVDDDRDDFFIARRMLANATAVEAELDWASVYDEGLEAVMSGRYDIALVDYRLGPHNGLDLLRTAVERGCRTPIILLTGQGDREVDLQAMAAGAADYLIKWEFGAPLLERSIRYARERKRAEERIREQAAFLDKARDAICAFDLDGQVIYWNKSAERITGYRADEVMGKTLDGLLYEAGDDKHARVHQAVREKGAWSGELHQTTREGGEIVVESRWTLVRDGADQPRSILVINTDVTERKRLEAQFLRAQRMESIGRLVSGIAHDLGNLLVPIMLGIKVLRQRYTDDEKTMRTLNMMQQSGQRGSDMVKQVLAFARGVEGERVSIQVAEVIREVEEITQETFPSGIEVETRVADDLWPVRGDATQLQQVLVNLCVNARDAMPDGGSLTLTARNVTLCESDATQHFDAEPGAYVCLRVQDTGSGIPPDVLDKIFEPFFTTKPTGEGTGLGLSTVYSIVKSHGGFVNVQSEESEGTTFDLFLPIVAEPEEEVSEAATVEARGGTGELVLVLDDEAFILETAREILENAGYSVMTASDGEEALVLCDEHADEIDAILTDLVMPGMNGLDFIRTVRRRHPHLPVMATSGMVDGKAEEALDAGARQFLAKPFTAEALCAALDKLLARELAE